MSVEILEGPFDEFVVAHPFILQSYLFFFNRLFTCFQGIVRLKGFDSSIDANLLTASFTSALSCALIFFVTSSFSSSPQFSSPRPAESNLRSALPSTPSPKQTTQFQPSFHYRRSPHHA